MTVTVETPRTILDATELKRLIDERRQIKARYDRTQQELTTIGKELAEIFERIMEARDNLLGPLDFD